MNGFSLNLVWKAWHLSLVHSSSFLHCLHEVRGENTSRFGEVGPSVRPSVLLCVSTQEPLGGLWWNFEWMLCHCELPLDCTFEYPTIGSNKTADEEIFEVGPTIGKWDATFWWPKLKPCPKPEPITSPSDDRFTPITSAGADQFGCSWSPQLASTMSASADRISFRRTHRFQPITPACADHVRLRQSRLLVPITSACDDRSHPLASITSAWADHFRLRWSLRFAPNTSVCADHLGLQQSLRLATQYSHSANLKLVYSLQDFRSLSGDRLKNGYTKCRNTIRNNWVEKPKAHHRL
jgi:hypothetical protein